ncbi:MAG: HVO_A0114 family putative DNA-binding protein [Allorhizobium sp.]|uniref:HVO_A0114 family putative DNA-binding protein n=1 Tax=Allorhizobium sp. TaxID=633478 RepID=UPI004034DF1E
MAERELNSVTISVCSLDESKERLAAAFRGEGQGSYIEFPTVEVLWKVLTAKRWEILQAMTGQDEMSIREIARRVGRDVKAVHGDVQGMLSAGLVDKTASGNVIFPYDEVHVDFKLRAA